MQCIMLFILLFFFLSYLVFIEAYASPVLFREAATASIIFIGLIALGPLLTRLESYTQFINYLIIHFMQQYAISW